MTATDLGPSMRKPPIVATGPVAWLRTNLFGSWFDAILTLIGLVIVWKLGLAVLQWGVIDAVASGGDAACKAPGVDGACWALVGHWWRFILFGRYPAEELWRPMLAVVLFVGAMGLSFWSALWWRRLGIVWAVVLVSFYLLVAGGVPGLPSVATEFWGGLPLTIIIAVFSLIFAFPLSVLLALGRRSDMPIVKGLCVGFIELVRGVPLISVLFMVSVTIPLFFPAGFGVDKLVRAIIGFTLFIAAYMAETVRAGLQAIPLGQYEAADALGLGYWTKIRKIILPQALRLVIPPMVNISISTFKDTSLVLIIGLYDLLSTAKIAITDTVWRSFYIEGYLFAAAIYFAFCLFMSKYSQMIERTLSQRVSR